MRFIRQALALKLITLLLLGSLCLTQTACGDEDKVPPTPAEMLAVAREVVATMRDVVPVLETNHVDTVRFKSGIGIGDKVVKAFENNQSGDVLLLFADLTKVVDQSVLEFDLIQDQTVKTIVLVSCVAFRSVLRRLATMIDRGVVAATTYGISLPGITAFQDSDAKTKAKEAKATLKKFLKQKEWRCRNAKTGRFEKMEFCKTNPDISYVDTYYRRVPVKP